MTKAQSLPKNLDMRNLGILVVGSLLFWLALIFPARKLGGDEGVFLSTVALGLCLIPAVASMAWALPAGTGAEAPVCRNLGAAGVRLCSRPGGRLLFMRYLREQI